MSLFSSIFQQKQPRYADRVAPSIENNVILTTSEDFRSATRIDYGMPTSSGALINERSARSISAVSACVRLIAGAISTLPVRIYDRKLDKVVNHDTWWLLNESPNEMYSSSVFMESFVSSNLLLGDGFASIKRPSVYSDKVSSIEWLPTNKTSVVHDSELGLIYTAPSFSADANAKPISRLSQDVLHLTGQGFDGLRSLSPLRYGIRETLGLSISATEYRAKFFENSARPDYAISFPKETSLSNAEASALKESIDESHGGSKNSHRPIVLQKGGKIEPISMSMVDAQMLETMNFTVEEIARFYGVPGHLIGVPNATSWGTGIESLSIGFITFCLLPIITRLEQEFNRKLFPSGKFHVKFDVSGLQRGDYTQRLNGYRMGLGRAGESPIYTVNEIRRLEGLEPKEGFDDLKEFNTGGNIAQPTI